MLLALLQFVVAWATVRRPALRRVTMDEVRQAVRATGSGDLSTIAAVVLETDGSLSVVPAGKAGDRSALEGVRGETGWIPAVVNAVHRATGVRVRDLPVTLDKLLSGLDRAVPGR